MLLTTPIPHAEGAAFIRSKPALTRAVFDALAPDLQARSYVITGVECLDAVARVRELTAQLPLGGDYDDLKSQILQGLSPWLITSTDPEEIAKQSAAAARRAEMLLRMHGWQAYAQTQDALLRSQEDIFPYRMYISSEDSRVRPSHAALNKKILPANHPFWGNHTPPWEFGCRCDCVPMTQEEVDDIAATEQADARPLEDRQVLGPEMLTEIEDNKRLVQTGGTGFLDLRTPREKSPDGTGYEFRPADNALDIDQILQRFTPPERQAFEAYAKNQTLEDGRTLHDWWVGTTTSSAPTTPAPTLPSPASTTAPVSRSIQIKTRVKAPARTTLAAIDSVHDDGILPVAPLDGSPGASRLGAYAYRGKATTRLSVKPSGPWQRLTLAHEVGHFLDHQAIGTPGVWATATGELQPVIDAIKATPTYDRLRLIAGKRGQYFRSPDELWARAYAQFIAAESQDPDLLADLRRVSTSYEPWRQWPDTEFQPIQSLIRSYFQTLHWIKP